MFTSRRLRRIKGHYANVDGIPFRMPVGTQGSPALFALYGIDAEAASAMLPGDELRPCRIWNRSVLVVAVVNYQDTAIGRYVEFCIGILCTRGVTDAIPMLPTLLRRGFGTGVYIYDLPVSTEISVKGGRGIWGMGKRQANLDFIVGEDVVSSQYDLDGQLVARIDVPRPARTILPFRISGVGYGDFRGMLTKSYVHLGGRLGLTLGGHPQARLLLGDHPRAAPLRKLDVDPQPLVTAFIPSVRGVLDDHVETWFLTYDEPPGPPEVGIEDVLELGLEQDWLAPPNRSHSDALLGLDTPGRHLKATGRHQPRLGGKGVRFTETMSGSFLPQGSETPQDLEFTLTITVDDVKPFLRDPEHAASAVGVVRSPWFGGTRTVSSATFNLFSPGRSADVRLMKYDLAFAAPDGRGYRLKGTKTVQDHAGLDLWPDTTTLQVVVEDDSTGESIGSGVLRITGPQFFRQLTTFRAVGTKGAGEAVRTLASFSGFFLGRLWHIYGPARRRQQGGSDA